jgi:hypothetical protein
LSSYQAKLPYSGRAIEHYTQHNRQQGLLTMAGTQALGLLDRNGMKFLRELGANNNRDWFGDNKHRYEEFVLDPALNFIEAMGPAIRSISGHFVAVPKRSGGSLMRVYRDTRSRNSFLTR